MLTDMPLQPSRDSAPVQAGYCRRAAADPFARRSRHCIQKKRRFAAEEWVKPEVDPPMISRYRATARFKRNEAMAREAEGF